MQNIAGWCQQTFPPIIWIFTGGEGDGIKFRLPFKIFSTLSCYLYEGADAPIKHKVVQESLTLFPLLVRCCAPS